MWGLSKGEGDFQDVAGSPTSAMFGLEYRHYLKGKLGLGVIAMYASLGYEFAMSTGGGLQIRADLVLADFQPSGGSFHPVGGNYYYYDENWDSGLTYFSIGLALVFGK